MSPFMKKAVKKAKLAFLWVERILRAPNHFGVSFGARLRLAVFGGYMVDQKALYDFDNNDKREYLSEFDWYRSRWINEPFDQMLNNKIICTEVLSPHAYVPKILFMKNKGRMVSLEKWRSDGYRSHEDVMALFKRFDVLFMKPLAAGKGRDVHRIEMEESLRGHSAHEIDHGVGGKVLVDGVPMSKDDFFAFLDANDEWFLSEGVRQHPFLDSLYDKTTNTIRLITLRDPKSGVYKVFFAVQRIGTSDTVPVDNGSRGGLIAKIDLDTGELSEARSLQALWSYDLHPDSGATIKGQRVPGWQALKTQMVELAKKFPFMNFIAWDILLTEMGPCIIEANTSSGVNIIQLWGPQRNGELGDFYRAHGVIK